MPTSKPNDRTTPPTTPRTNNHSQTSRLYATVSRTFPRHADPRDARSVWPHDPRPPREYGAQDGLRNRFTWDSYYSAKIQAAQQVPYGLNFYSPRIPGNNTIHSQPLSVRPGHKQEKHLFKIPSLPSHMLSQT